MISPLSPHYRLYLVIRAILVVIGGFMVHLSLGTIYTFGNIAPYIVSYVRNQSHPANLTEGTTTWIFAFALIGQGGAMFLGGWMVRKIGPRWTTLIGGLVMSTGVTLTYFTIKVSFWLVLLTYGFLFGVGVGIAYIGPLSAAMKWLPKWKGFANGIVVAGFGLGALIYNAVQTTFVNPHNFPTHKDENGEDYFTDPDLLHRVPIMFLLLGGSYAVLQVIGSLLITFPPEGYGTLEQDKAPELDKSWPYCEVDDNSFKKKDSSLQPKGGSGHLRVVKSSPDVNSRLADGRNGGPKEEEEREKLLRDSSSPTYSRESTIDGKSDLESSLSSSILDQPSNNIVTSLRPLQMLKKPNFYMLWSMFLVNGVATLLTATLYKFFGLEIVKDDHFLASVGSVAAIFNCLGRIVWGIVADRVSYKFALTLISGIMTIFLLTLYACFALHGAAAKAYFFIWICAIFFCIGGNFSVFPTATARAYGIQYVSMNYGLLFTSQIIAGSVGAFLSTALKTRVGFSGLFFVVSGFSGFGMFLALIYRPKRYISLQTN